MRKLLFVWLLLLCIGFSQAQSVVNASRYFPKADKVMEFEKALTAHIAKYHSGEWAWRVYEIQTGPDAGGYQVTEGPKTWDEFDKRGNLGDEHIRDWNKNVAIYLTDKYSSMYAEYNADLSTAQVGDFTDKISITHVFPKPGAGGMVQETIGKARKAWESGGQTVAVYQSVASGPSQYALVYRLKGGMGEFKDGFRKPMKERYDAANGEGTYETFINKITEATQEAWSELLIFRSDLSAK